MTRPAIGVFAKAPVPGRTKTRLIPAVGERGAAALHRSFLADTLSGLSSMGELMLFITEPHPALAEAAASNAAAIVRQQGDDLGERMLHAMEVLLRAAPTAVVLGSDSPTLPPPYIARAASSGLAFGPSADGGFYTVSGRVLPDFLGVPWSSSSTLSEALARNPAAERLAPWFDVDTPDDLRLLTMQLRLQPSAAPRTHRTLVELGLLQ